MARMSDFISYIYVDIITYPCPNIHADIDILIEKQAPVVWFYYGN